MTDSGSIPFFGARGKARQLAAETRELHAALDAANAQLARLGVYSVVELENIQARLISDIRVQRDILSDLETRQRELRASIVLTEETAMLQESGYYEYRHPLADAVAYQAELSRIQNSIKTMMRRDGGAVLASTTWQVNGSAAEGRRMVTDFSKLLLRAYNAEADNLVRGLKPYKLDAAIDRLTKAAIAIAKLGKTMSIQISDAYHSTRVRELELTADYVAKVAEERERDREDKARLREEARAQQEFERERLRLQKEHAHYTNAMNALIAKGDTEGAERLQTQIDDLSKAINDVDYRAANIRAGYVYVISNIGSFGEEMVKIGMTRRLEPRDRVRELSDASVPFNFDIHALFFSDDAVGIETTMHQRLADKRVNRVNPRREFFRITPSDAKSLLLELAGDLLQYEETPEAVEYRQSISPDRRGRDDEGTHRHQTASESTASL